MKNTKLVQQIAYKYMRPSNKTEFNQRIKLENKYNDLDENNLLRENTILALI